MGAFGVDIINPFYIHSRGMNEFSALAWSISIKVMQRALNSCNNGQYIDALPNA